MNSNGVIFAAEALILGELPQGFIDILWLNRHHCSLCLRLRHHCIQSILPYSEVVEIRDDLRIEGGTLSICSLGALTVLVILMDILFLRRRSEISLIAPLAKQM
eukprot:Gregarina_sp_Poly_1__10243@NODE_712_length_6650_cov_47_311864_g538_i0_p9_GENE_NODE_712_length_6650_cov_47_311864_g538_i0NODE_712_length_6650_cov_47_311864_g538_i0_p9_ORF_typecomplete_len104_score5_99FYVE/PF01363_21/13_NODE_712_length_6650_cov_47_311864_g538_i0247558